MQQKTPSVDGPPVFLCVCFIIQEQQHICASPTSLFNTPPLHLPPPHKQTCSFPHPARRPPGHRTTTPLMRGSYAALLSTLQSVGRQSSEEGRMGIVSARRPVRDTCMTVLRCRRSHGGRSARRTLVIRRWRCDGFSYRSSCCWLSRLSREVG